MKLVRQLNRCADGSPVATRRLEEEAAGKGKGGFVEPVSCRRGHLRIQDLARLVDEQLEADASLEAKAQGFHWIRRLGVLAENGWHYVAGCGPRRSLGRALCGVGRSAVRGCERRRRKDKRVEEGDEKRWRFHRGARRETAADGARVACTRTIVPRISPDIGARALETSVRSTRSAGGGEPERSGHASVGAVGSIHRLSLRPK